MKVHFGCPVQATANAIAGKWKVQIIWQLAYRPRRFSELRRLLPNVSEKVLTAQLRELEADFILRREAVPTQPPQVTYSLTPAGEELLPGLQLLCEWGTKHLGVRPRLPPRPGIATALMQG
ncbi:MAG TPA: helix-turn-helix domain-containing protein [Acidobacteriaceae bacterium]|nr:helix-turn-helix domain-containing protein [Acidobacteriaceae bacterium]